MNVRRVSRLLKARFYVSTSALALCAVVNAQGLIAPKVVEPRAVVLASDGLRALGKIVVIVNGQAITDLDLARRQRFLVEQLRRSKQEIPTDGELYKAVLERAVLEAVMLQNAAKAGLVPNDFTVQQALAENAAQAGMTPEVFLSNIARTGTTNAEYMADLKNEIAMTSYREKELQGKVKLTEGEIDRFLRDPQSGVQQTYQVQALFVPVPDGASSTERANARGLAQSLRTRARSATNAEQFAALQNSVNADIGKHSVDQGSKTLDKYPEVFSAALDGLNAGEVTDVLESSAGFYVLRVANKRTLLPQVQQTKVRHILIRVDANTPDDKARGIVQSIHNRLTLDNGLFPTLAKQFGQDASNNVGGDLGWTLPGDMVPEFEKAMDVLKSGELGLPVRTQFGWHVLQVMERENREVPQERLRAQARTVLRARKQDEAMVDWLEQIKSQAFVEYKN